MDKAGVDTYTHTHKRYRYLKICIQIVRIYCCIYYYKRPRKE